MPPGPALLRAEARRGAIDLLQRGDHRLCVQLPALRQISLLVEVLDREQRAAPFARAPGERGRLDLEESLPAEVLMDRPRHLRAYLEDGRLPARADPEMPHVQQVLGALVLRDGELVRGAHDAQ